MNIKYLYIILILFLAQPATSQDFHFSQYNDAPLLLNPALTGSFNGGLRAHIYFRNQWKKIINPYETFGASLDTRFINKNKKSGFLAFGISIMKDVSGKSELATTQSLISVAFHKRIEKNSYFAGGIQGGFTQKKINYSNLYWDNQYDPNIPGFNAALSHKETGLTDGFSYTDVSGGVLYNLNTHQTPYHAFRHISFQSGIAYYHFVKTDKSFTEIYNNPMYAKFLFHSRAVLGITKSGYSFIPSMLCQFQGPNRELIFGAAIKRSFVKRSVLKLEKPDNGVTLGYMVRLSDAFIPYISFDFVGLSLQISYDVNFSDLKKNTKRVGAFEINLRYIKP